MAKYYSSTFGKISGKHGNAVAVIRKDGTAYLKIHKAASNPRTDKQQAHRAKFALTSKSLAPFNHIFKETMGITNGISIARSYAFKNAIVDEYPNYSIDYEKIMFSFGAIEKLHNTSHTRNDGLITINWDFEEMYNCQGGDSVSIVVFNKEANQAIHIDDVGLRSDKMTKIDIHDAWSDAELYFWAYVKRGGEYSDSVYVDLEVETSRSLSGLCDCTADNYRDDCHNNSNTHPIDGCRNRHRIDATVHDVDDSHVCSREDNLYLNKIPPSDLMSSNAYSENNGD